MKIKRNYLLKFSLFLILTGYSVMGIAQNQIHFSGNIQNCSVSKFKIGRVDKPSDGNQWQKVKIKKGNFSLVIKTNEPSVFRCYSKSGEFDFYAMPGDSLTLTADYNKLLPTIKFDGKGRKTAQFHTAWKQKFKALNNSDFDNYDKCNPKRYLELRKKLLDSELTFLNDYVAKNGLKESPFFNYYASNFKFRFYSDIRDYITYHNNIEEEGLKTEYLPLLKLLDGIDYNNPNLVETEAYMWHLVGYINQVKYRQLIYNKELPNVIKDSVHWTARTYLLSKEILNIKAHESYVMTSLFEHINPLTVGILAPIYEHFIKTCSRENRLILQDAFKRYKRLNKKQKIHRDSKIIETDSGLTEIIQSHKGSLLYIDFWASWCGPCIGEIPASKEIQEKFKNKDVKFLFISVDQDENSWKKAITVYKIPGIHYRLEKEKSAELLESLLSKGVPHYLIVGRDGKIIDRNAKRPTDQGLDSDLDKLLNN